MRSGGITIGSAEARDLLPQAIGQAEDECFRRWLQLRHGAGGIDVFDVVSGRYSPVDIAPGSSLSAAIRTEIIARVQKRPGRFDGGDQMIANGGNRKRLGQKFGDAEIPRDPNLFAIGGAADHHERDKAIRTILAEAQPAEQHIAGDR